MLRLGLSPDELAASWRPAAYAARVPGLNVLVGETLALVGPGSSELLHALADALERCTFVDGGVAAAGGTLRIHAQQAARVGMRAVAISEPFARLGPEATALAVADVAGLGSLGITTVFEAADPGLAALAADRVAVVREGEPVVTYPVLAPSPRTREQVEPVTARLQVRLAG
jgi:hypothetical protein